MRVLYFHQHFSTPSGSTGTRSYEMSQALIKAGHRVTIVCGSYDQGKTGLSTAFIKGRRRGFVDGIDVIEFNLKYANNMRFWQRIFVFSKFAFGSIKIALTEPADIVFATTTPLTVAFPGIIARWFRRKPFVFEVRDLWPELPKAMNVITNPLFLWFLSCFEWLSYHSANRLIGLSPGIVDGIVSRGVSESKVKLVPNGSDLSIFSDDITPNRPDGVGDDQILAIYTGTHGVANGLESVLNTAIVLKQRKRNDIVFALVGKGHEKLSLQEKAISLKLDNILFIEPIPKVELSSLLAGADIGMQVLKNVPAFYYGTSPNKFFDYLSAGLPVLNNYPGWISDLIRENNCGLLVPPDDPVAFADALILASENKENLRIMGFQARKLAETEFSRELLANVWIEWVLGVNK